MFGPKTHLLFNKLRVLGGSLEVLANIRKITKRKANEVVDTLCQMRYYFKIGPKLNISHSHNSVYGILNIFYRLTAIF